MSCAGRYNDGPRGNGQDLECINFNSGIPAEACDAAIGDDDDICVCSRPPTTFAACSTVVGDLGSGDAICGDQCTDGSCDCAVLFDTIPPGESCTSMCAQFNMNCTARFDDGPRLPGRQCENFAARTNQQPCDAVRVGDDDDVCVCSRPRGEDECPGGPNNVFFTEIPATLEACQAADDCLPGGLSFSSVECRAAPCNSYCEGDGLCPGIGDEARFTGTCDPPGDFDGQGLDVYFKACGTAVAVSDLPEPPLCSATPAPPQSPTTAPTQSPTDIHAVCQPFAAALEPGDLICGAVCAGPTCSCGVLFDSIPTDGSCTTMCAEFGMVCVARHNDGPRIADMVCRDFVNNVAAPDACDDTFDDDDICVCSPTTSVPARHLMRRSVVMHGGSSNKGPLEAGETSQATVAVLVVAGVLMTLATLARASVGANPNVEVVLRA